MILHQWDQQLSTGETDEITHQLASWHLGEIPACPQSDSIRNLVRNNDLLGLINFELDYRLISGSSAYHLRQVLAFFQKRADYDLGIDKESVAIEKFRESEVLCKQTNEIIRKVHQGGFCFPPDVNSVLHTAQRKIASILGDCPTLNDIKPHFGPGATTQIKKRQASARNKLGQTFACSRDFIPLLEEAMDEIQGWVFDSEDPDSVQVPVEIHCGKLASVPKNAKTNRCIVVEPSLNSFFQLGVGEHMTRRLKRFGVDLSDQTRNQRMAREGSLTGELATLDLSSASDTVARLLIQDLLPLEWCDLIFRCSTSVVQYKDEHITLEKVSSMGNGITFPLESLIFYALAVSCCEGDEVHNVSVYGDDIIIPTHRYELLCKVLHAVGFIPNREKSFSDGPFRESCGKDYLSGIDIRPAYIKDRVTGADVFVLHNYYVRTYQPEPASLLASLIDPSIKLYGPDGYGDGHLLGDYTPIRKEKHVNKGFGGHIFETFTWKKRSSYRTLPGDRVLPAYTVYANPAKAGLPGIATEVNRSIFRILGYTHKRFVEPFYDVSESSISYRRPRKGKPHEDISAFGVTLPGRRGCKRISIYTLNPTSGLVLQ